MADTIIEEKGVRRVRTPEGVRRFGEPIGAPILVNAPALKRHESVSADLLRRGDAVLEGEDVRVVQHVRKDGEDVVMRTSNIKGKELRRKKVNGKSIFRRFLVGLGVLAVALSLPTGADSDTEQWDKPVLSVAIVDQQAWSGTDVQDAMDQWSPVIPMRFTKDTSKADITLTLGVAQTLKDSDKGDMVGASATTVLDGTKIVGCNVGIAPDQSRKNVTELLAHELGHCLGLSHKVGSKKHPTVMHFFAKDYDGGWSDTVTKEDLDSVRKLYGMTIPSKKAEEAGMETKVIRHVRTPAGVAKYKQPIGSVIVRDSVLKNITGMESDFPGWSKYNGADGHQYYVGKYRRGWVATNTEDEVLFSGKDEEEVTRKLNEGIKPRLGYRGVVVRKANQKERAAVRARQAKPTVVNANTKKILPGIKKVRSDYDGYEKFRGVDEQDYYIYKGKNDKWYAVDADDRKLFGRWASYEKDEVLTELDALVMKEASVRAINERRGLGGPDYVAKRAFATENRPPVGQIIKFGASNRSKGMVVALGAVVDKKNVHYPFITVESLTKTKKQKRLFPAGKPGNDAHEDTYKATAERRQIAAAPVQRQKAPAAPKVVPARQTAPVAAPAPSPAPSQANVLTTGGLGRAIILQTAPLNGFTNTTNHYDRREADIAETISKMSTDDLKNTIKQLRAVLSQADARQKPVINSYIKRMIARTQQK